MNMRKEIYEYLISNRNKFKDRKKLRDVLESKFHIDSTTAYKYILLFDFIQERFKERVNQLLKEIEKKQRDMKRERERNMAIDYHYKYSDGYIDGLDVAKELVRKAFEVDENEAE